MVLSLLACAAPGEAHLSPHPGVTSEPPSTACEVVTGPEAVVAIDADGRGPTVLGSGRVHLADDGRVSLVVVDDGAPDGVGSIVRLSDDGAYDPTLHGDGTLRFDLGQRAIRLEWRADGSFWLQRADRLERRLPDGELDPTFGQGGISARLGTAELVAVDRDGAALLTEEGWLGRVGDDGVPRDVAGVSGGDGGWQVEPLSDGTVALFSGGDVVLVGEDGTVAEVAVPDDARWLGAGGAGDFYVWSAYGDARVERYDTAGDLLDAFDVVAREGWTVEADALAADASGALWLGGVMYADDPDAPDPHWQAAAWRLAADGTPDPCVGEAGRVDLPDMWAAHRVANVLADGTAAFVNAEDTYGAVVAWVRPGG